LDNSASIEQLPALSEQTNLNLVNVSKDPTSYSQAFLINHVDHHDQNLTCERLSLYSAAIIYSCALSMMLKKGEVSECYLFKASRLCDQSVRLLQSVDGCFDCSVPLQKAIGSMVRIHYLLGDFQTVKSLYEVLFQIAWSCVFDQEEATTKPTTAPMA
jgi:hypothetical protein